MYCGTDVGDGNSKGIPAAPRIFGIALVTAVFLAFGTAGARFLNNVSGRAAARDIKPSGRSFSSVSGAIDLENILPVPPSGKRVYAFRQTDDPDSMMIMYLSRSLAPEQAAEFYLDEMPVHGWREGENEEQELNKHVEDIMLFFKRQGRECTIYIEPDGSGAVWTVISKPVIIGGSR